MAGHLMRAFLWRSHGLKNLWSTQLSRQEKFGTPILSRCYSKGFSESGSAPDKTAEEAVNSILYNTPTVPTQRERHVLSVLVTNEPGVLSRVSGVLASRGFNIDSLVVSATEVKELSRMTIVLKGAATVVEQARMQMEDVVQVWAVIDYYNKRIVERELLLCKVATTYRDPKDTSKAKSGASLDSESSDDFEKNNNKRRALKEIAELFDGRIVDISRTNLTVELCTYSRRIDAFLQLVKPFHIIESVRSGVLAMPRSPIDASSGGEEKEEQIEGVDATLLPPG